MLEVEDSNINFPCYQSFPIAVSGSESLHQQHEIAANMMPVHDIRLEALRSSSSLMAQTRKLFHKSHLVFPLILKSHTFEGVLKARTKESLSLSPRAQLKAV